MGAPVARIIVVSWTSLLSNSTAAGRIIPASTVTNWKPVIRPALDLRLNSMRRRFCAAHAALSWPSFST